MKSINRFLLVAVIILFIGIAACSPKEVQIATPDQKTIETEIADSTKESPLATPSIETQIVEPTSTEPAAINVDALIREKLQNHHSIDRVYAAKKTREEWNATLDRMIGYGAKISEDEKQIIIDYLLNR